jgi:hypothetical protein
MSNSNELNWEHRKHFISQNWPSLSERDLKTLQKHPENLIIKLQKNYHYSKFESYQAYFDMMRPDRQTNESIRQ